MIYKTDNKMTSKIVPSHSKMYMFMELDTIGEKGHPVVDEDFSREVFRSAAAGFGLEVTERVMTSEEIYDAGDSIEGSPVNKRFLVMWA